MANSLNDCTGAKTAKPPTQSECGITLIEIMIGLMVITMIAAIAYPSYKEPVLDVHRSLAKTLLLDILEKQQNFYIKNNTYTTALEQLGYTLKDGGVETIGWHYLITVENCKTPLPDQLDSCIQLVAKVQHDEIDDETITINSAGWKSPINEW